MSILDTTGQLIYWRRKSEQMGKTRHAAFHIAPKRFMVSADDLAIEGDNFVHEIGSVNTNMYMYMQGAYYAVVYPQTIIQGGR
ncbi:hypothetical protein Daus18300_009413 [Diaporthe australafricana]|uniref:Uncharacterized protein n=1 Tax=Diaporthe australafricana TaxID=127596 RepID=A0ABR3WE08_9PEZI